MLCQEILQGKAVWFLETKGLWQGGHEQLRPVVSFLMKTKNKKNKHIGSSFDDFLKEEACPPKSKHSATPRRRRSLVEEVNLNALKSILAFLLQQEMEESCTTQTTMAKRLGTSRAGLKRLLDPTNYSITLLTLNKVATVLGKKLDITLR
jgi:hypothetical protein